MADVKKVEKYTKTQILQSEKFAEYRDVLNVVLKDGVEYTMQQVLEARDKFLNTPVIELRN